LCYRSIQVIDIFLVQFWIVIKYLVICPFLQNFQIYWNIDSKSSLW
jgi:hypothetical protein